MISAQFKCSFSMVAVIATSLMTSTAQADIASGIVVRHHLNGSIGNGRGVCIQLSPAIPAPGWACLYKTNALYAEIAAMLMSAYLTQTPITISSTAMDANQYLIIDVVD